MQPQPRSKPRLPNKFRPFSSNVQISCNTLTSEYKSGQDLLNLIPVSTNFHTIPYGNISYSYIDTWYVISQILKYRLSTYFQKLFRNKILDVTLPLEIDVNNGDAHDTLSTKETNIDSDKNRQTKLCRFIFYDNQLVGMRPEFNNIQERKIMKGYVLPQLIRQYRKNYRTPTVPFGQFCLKLDNTKIGFIFESEIKSFQTQIFQDYLADQCEIISVVSNHIFSSSSSFNMNQIVNHTNLLDKTAIVYSSMLFAPSSQEMYTGGSFISLGKKVIVKSQKNIYQGDDTIIGRIDLGEIKFRKFHREIKGKFYQITFTNHKNRLKEISLPYYFYQKQKFVPEQQYKVCRNSLRTLKSSSITSSNLEEVKKYHAWYLFNKINKRCPFLISTRLDNSTKELIVLINEICEERASPQRLYQITMEVEEEEVQQEQKVSIQQILIESSEAEQSQSQYIDSEENEEEQSQSAESQSQENQSQSESQRQSESSESSESPITILRSYTQQRQKPQRKRNKENQVKQVGNGKKLIIQIQSSSEQNEEKDKNPRPKLNKEQFRPKEASKQPPKVQPDPPSLSQLLSEMLVIYDIQNNQIQDTLIKQILQKIPQNFIELNKQKNILTPWLLQKSPFISNAQNILQQKLSQFQRLIFYTKNQKQIEIIRKIIEHSDNVHQDYYQKISLYTKFSWFDIPERLQFSKKEMESTLEQLQRRVQNLTSQEEISKVLDSVLKKPHSEKKLMSTVQRLFPQNAEHIIVNMIPKMIYKKGLQNDKKHDYYTNNIQNYQKNNQQKPNSQLSPNVQKDVIEDGQFTNKIEQIRRIKRQKQYTCHLCLQSYLSKFIIQCTACQSKFCLDCLEIHDKNFQLLNSWKPSNTNDNKNDQKQFMKSCRICRNQCSCNKCCYERKQKQFLSSCHKCQHFRSQRSKSAKNCLIQCKNTCKQAFCLECFAQIQKVQTVTLEMIKDWTCFVCQAKCHCPLCTFRREQKSLIEIQMNSKMSDKDKEKEMEVESLNSRPMLIRSMSDIEHLDKLSGIGGLARHQSMIDLPPTAQIYNTIYNSFNGNLPTHIPKVVTFPNYTPHYNLKGANSNSIVNSNQYQHERERSRDDKVNVDSTAKPAVSPIVPPEKSYNTFQRTFDPRINRPTPNPAQTPVHTLTQTPIHTPVTSLTPQIYPNSHHIPESDRQLMKQPQQRNIYTGPRRILAGFGPAADNKRNQIEQYKKDKNLSKEVDRSSRGPRSDTQKRSDREKKDREERVSKWDKKPGASMTSTHQNRHQHRHQSVYQNRYDSNKDNRYEARNGSRYESRFSSGEDYYRQKPNAPVFQTLQDRRKMRQQTEKSEQMRNASKRRPLDDDLDF